MKLTLFNRRGAPTLDDVLREGRQINKYRLEQARLRVEDTERRLLELLKGEQETPE